MPEIARTVVVVPAGLAPADKARLIDDLWTVKEAVFDGGTKEHFAEYVVDSPNSVDTVVLVHRNSDGDAVGYLAFHVFEKQVDGRTIAVFRAEAGSRREYRGNGANPRLMLSQIARYRLRHPSRPQYYLGTLVHPSSYLAFCRYAPLVWPRRDHELPPDDARLMVAMAGVFGARPVDAADPFVVQAHWRTRDSDVERAYWRSCDKPDARFFVQRNPGYSSGHGLVTVVPLTLALVTGAARRVVGEMVRRRLGPPLARVAQLPGLRGTVGMRQIRRRLAGTALFADLADADLTAAARLVEVVGLGSGQNVFRAGDASDALYVVDAGSVVVTEVATLTGVGEEAVDTRGPASGSQELLIDQLAAGALFGELGALSGAARTATIRTATRTTLLRIRASALTTLMQAHPAVDAAVRAAYARHRFLDVTSGDAGPRPMLTREARIRWLATGTPDALPAGQEVSAGAPWLFVVSGVVDVAAAGATSIVRGPALVSTDDDATLIAQESARVVRLPDPDRALGRTESMPEHVSSGQSVQVDA